jgi:hypothetical protein
MSEMFRCLSCGEMIFIDSGTCRFCNAPIDAAAARDAAQQLATVTHACSMANNMKVARFAALGFIVGQTFFTFSPAIPRLWLFAQLAPPSAAWAAFDWLRRYGSLATTDPDFPQARKDTERTFYVWLATFILQLVLLGVFLLRVFLP